MRLTALILTFAAALAIAPAAVAQEADVTGTWSATFTTDGQDHPATITLKKEGPKAVGRISSTERGDTDIAGTVEGKTVAFSFTMQGENGAMPISMKGAVEGDTMKGTFDYGGGTGTWTATRGAAQSKEPPKGDATAAKVDVTGTWLFAIELANISATPTVILKQDGESLTGEYQSQQYGKFPLKGTIKGNQIEFGFEMAIEGNAVAVSYAGTVDKDTMKGEMSYGGLADGTFTAERKK